MKKHKNHLESSLKMTYQEGFRKLDLFSPEKERVMAGTTALKQVRCCNKDKGIKLLIMSTEDETRGNGQGKFGLETLQVFWCLYQADDVTARYQEVRYSHSKLNQHPKGYRWEQLPKICPEESCQC